MLQTERISLTYRPRRNRKSPAIRELLQETTLLPSDLIVPFFITEGEEVQEPIEQMPGVARLSVDLLIEEATSLLRSGVSTIALFPYISNELRDSIGSESHNSEGLLPWAVRILKKALPEITIISDIALDPYTDTGHDGLLDENLQVDNDQTLIALGKQALCHAEAGVDVIAPSDMMDGRVGYLRSLLDDAGYTDVSILSYTAKYVSNLYGPFRYILDSKPAFGDKKGYQLNPANIEEALYEAELDIQEGADMLMVKPASIYLDVVAKISAQTHIPVGAYHVSGEYAMAMAAHNQGLLDAPEYFLETLLSIKRAGARFIFTYAAPHVLPLIN